jgi:hypothetical protein
MRYAEPELMELLALAYASPFEKREHVLTEIPKLIIGYMQRLYGTNAIINFEKVSDTKFRYTIEVK